MNIKKEYEKFFERKKNDLCVHDAEDVIAFAKHYQALQLQQNGVSGCFCSNCRWLNSCAIRIDYNVDTCEEHEF